MSRRPTDIRLVVVAHSAASPELVKRPRIAAPIVLAIACDAANPPGTDPPNTLKQSTPLSVQCSRTWTALGMTRDAISRNARISCRSPADERRAGAPSVYG